MNARELIEDIRGGVPGKCDFCENETPDHQLHPEEAGDWACIFCILRWEANDMIADNKTMDTEQLNKLATDIHDLAKSKGWHSFEETDEEFVGRAGNNLHAEISELWEAHRAGTLSILCDKADKMRDAGIEPLTCAEEEVADIVIRELDSCRRVGVKVAMPEIDAPASGDFTAFVTTLHACATAVSLSFKDEMFHARLLMWVMRLSNHLKIELWSAVARKHAFNATRPFRHGGKKA